MSMFCYQCQETAQNKGCTVMGVCGKTADVANLQDLLVYVIKGISCITTEMRRTGKEVSKEVDRFITESLFMTITNANFHKKRFEDRITEAITLRDRLVKEVNLEKIDIEEELKDCLTWKAPRKEEMERKAEEVGVLQCSDEDIRSLRELVTYGLKGMAAYTEHASNLGYEEEPVYAFIQEALSLICSKLPVDELVALVLRTGETGVQAMALLDKANTSAYGNPEITKVNIGVRKNPAILISGHDLRDLEDLLEQTQGTGVDVYTHSEMLPAHYYPAFKKYDHFVGNYGNAWWKQVEEFESFNGPVIFTTNCIVPPRHNSTYLDRIYTTGASGFPGFKHIPNRSEGGRKDFSEIIEHAKRCDPPTEIESGEITGGFAHQQVFALADQIVAAVKSGAIKKFYVMGGCDGRQKGRAYYSDFAKGLSEDTIILTAGCAKYRYNKLALGEIGGIPRVLDAGQCNDSYSLALIALKLKEIFGLEDINDLPIIYNIAWYEQKAVIVLLALLSIGVKNIHLGPTLPGFLSPNVADVLVKNFGITPIGSAEEDLKTLA